MLSWNCVRLHGGIAFHCVNKKPVKVWLYDIELYDIVTSIEISKLFVDQIQLVSKVWGK